VKYNIFDFIYLGLFIFFFFNSPTGQTPERILTRDGLKDAFSRKEVPLWVKKVEINIEPLFMLPKVKFWQKVDL